ncbi:MAG: flagellar basal body-associated FliL family protein [Treponema sp.]|nr:flagellar basal body-associated FliL family protein [Treponema sp.]
MSDSDDLDLDGGEAPESGGSSKKKSGGLGNLLPTILKFVAIGLGATVFIVTVSLITVNVVNSRGASQTVINDPSSPYVGTRPVYAYYDGIGSMSVSTSDYPLSVSVTVDMIIGYDLDDTTASQELISRRYELRDFVRRYFRQKTAAELVPEREETLKAEIREMLNTRFLDSRGARVILFNRLDVMESNF